MCIDRGSNPKHAEYLGTLFESIKSRVIFAENVNAASF
jgi:hypothetical protein